MDNEYIERCDVINRYIQGHLSEEELVEFELYYLEHPEVLEDVELARALQAGLQANSAILTNRQSSEEERSSIFDRIASWFQNPAVLAGNFALIAGLAVTVSLDRQQASPMGFAADRVWVGDVRGERAPLEIDMRSASLVLDIDVAAPGNYSVTLVDAAGKQVTRVPEVAASSDALLVVFDASRLDAGTYRLSVDDPGSRTVLDRELIIRVPE